MGLHAPGLVIVPRTAVEPMLCAFLLEMSAQRWLVIKAIALFSQKALLRTCIATMQLLGS